MKTLFMAVLFAITSSVIAGETAPIAGRLCIAGLPCVEHTCGESIDTPAAERKAFTFTTGNGIHLGFLEPGRTSIDCSAGGTLELRLTAANRARIAIGPWTIAVSPQSKPFMITLPRGEYALAVEAPHQIAFRKTINVGGERLSVIAELKPFPTLSGRVITNEAKPVAGALITTDTTDSATTDAMGRFGLEIDPDKWPTHVTVEAIGFGETSVYVPRPRVNTVLDDIRVVPGASVAVDVRGGTDALEIALEKRIDGRLEGTPYKRVSGTHATFTGVEPGSYVVLLKGTGPCQRHGTLIDVAAGDRKTIEVAIEPFALHVRTAMASQLLPLTAVVLRNRDFHWQGEFKTDSASEATVELWQGGKSTIWLAEKNVMTVPYRDDRELANGNDAEWIIDIPGREIDGVVVDSQSGEPVPNASVALRVQDVENGIGVHTKTDDQGRFRFVPAPYGRHIVNAASSDHLPAEISYMFLEPEQSRTVTLRLDAAVKVRLTVEDQRGQPLAGARVIQFRNGAIAGAGDTNADGTIDIPAAKDEPRDVYIVPRDGSFAFLQIRDDQPQVVRVPDGTSRLLIRTESAAQAPPSDRRIAISLNGHEIPRDVLSTLAQLRGVSPSAGAGGRIVIDRMPPGVYELRVGAGVKRITAGPGDNEVAITLPE